MITQKEVDVGPCTITVDGKELLLKEGPLDEEQARRVIGELTECWHRLGGHKETAMKADKLGRAENLRVEGGRLRFDIERHAGTMNGSTRATLYTWELARNGNSVGIVHDTYRQLKATAKSYTKVDARKDAQAVIRVVTGRRKNRGEMHVIDTNKVVIYANRFVILGDYKQTRIGRRKQFIMALNEVLPARGWVVVDSNCYESDEITLGKVVG